MLPIKLSPGLQQTAPVLCVPLVPPSLPSGLGSGEGEHGTAFAMTDIAITRLSSLGLQNPQTLGLVLRPTLSPC